MDQSVQSMLLIILGVIPVTAALALAVRQKVMSENQTGDQGCNQSHPCEESEKGQIIKCESK
eukprot:2653935-Amphidinium_carterae.1